MSTRPPVSTPADHEIWERKRLETIAKDAGGAVVKITDPILDSRWAVIFGTALCSILCAIGLYMYSKMESFSTKQDVFLEKIGELNTKIGQESAERSVLKVQINAIEQRVGQHDMRLDRLERRP